MCEEIFGGKARSHYSRRSSASHAESLSHSLLGPPTLNYAAFRYQAARLREEMNRGIIGLESRLGAHDHANNCQFLHLPIALLGSFCSFRNQSSLRTYPRTRHICKLALFGESSSVELSGRDIAAGKNVLHSFWFTFLGKSKYLSAYARRRCALRSPDKNHSTKECLIRSCPEP